MWSVELDIFLFCDFFPFCCHCCCCRSWGTKKCKYKWKYYCQNNNNDIVSITIYWIFVLHGCKFLNRFAMNQITTRCSEMIHTFYARHFPTLLILNYYCVFFFVLLSESFQSSVLFQMFASVMPLCSCGCCRHPPHWQQTWHCDITWRPADIALGLTILVVCMCNYVCMFSQQWQHKLSLLCVLGECGNSVCCEMIQ